MRKSEIQWSLIFGFTCFLIFISSTLISQTLLVQGVVRDKADGKPLANIKIHFLNLRNGMEFHCKSNKKGKYIRAGIPDGLYQVKAKATEYFPYQNQIRIGGVDRTILDIELEKIPEKVEEDPFFAKGMEHFQAKRFTKATACFRESLKKFPESVEVNFNLGISLVSSGNIAEAEPILKKVMALKTDMPGINLALGNLYAKKGDSKKALAFLEKAAQQEPKNKIVPYFLGIEYFKMGQTEKALNSFDQVIVLDAEFGAAYYQAGVASSGLGNYKKAVGYFQKFLELEPKSPEAAQVRKMIEDLKKIK